MTSPLQPRVVPHLASLGEKWRAFWFANEPAYTLGIVRIAFGALMVYVTIDLLPSLTQLFGENGPVPSQPTTEFHWIYPYTYGIFQFWTSDTALFVGWAILLLSAVSLLVGWHSRLAAVLVWIVFLSFSKDVEPGDHPFYKHVYIRLMPVGTMKAKVIAYVYGGQGTINVPSWSPDGKRIAFSSNTDR